MRVRINNNQPNAEQRKALKQEVAKEFGKLLKQYNHDTAWLCEKQLKEDGIDINKLLEE